MIRPLALVALLVSVSACVEVVPIESGDAPVLGRPAAPPVGRAQALANFSAVVERLEPVAESECRRRTRGVNCDFQVILDTNPQSQPNAYQTLDRSGRPIIGFTQTLVQQTRNQDELAFVFAHEAAHHIEGHIAETQQQALGGAVIGNILAGVLGVDARGAEVLTDVGATVGARRYSKAFELEADALGTVIAARAGYDPVRGAQFFNRIPDPGDRFLGTHPPNADRMRTVERVAAGL